MGSSKKNIKDYIKLISSHSSDSEKRPKYTITFTNCKNLTVTLVSPNFIREKKLEKNHSFDKYSIPRLPLFKPISKNLKKMNIAPRSAHDKYFGKESKKLYKVNYLLPYKKSKIQRKYDMLDRCVINNSTIFKALKLLFSK